MNAVSQTNTFSLERNAFGQMVLSLADGRTFEGVEVIRAFPISAPGELVSICDAEGHEVLCIEDPSALAPRLQEIVEAAIAEREFMPTVVQIESVLADADPSQWKVVTSRGPVTFLMEDSDNDVRRLGPDSILLVDIHGIRYLIPDTRCLDAASRKILDRYL
jgi:hypothetical protein